MVRVGENRGEGDGGRSGGGIEGGNISNQGCSGLCFALLLGEFSCVSYSELVKFLSVDLNAYCLLPLMMVGPLWGVTGGCWIEKAGETKSRPPTPGPAARPR